MDLLAPALTRIAHIEAAAADALAPAEERLVDGWRLRFNHGVSRRGNSVLAEARGTHALARKLREVQSFYRDRGLPARVQLSPASRPRSLDRTLEERGWRLDPGALVLWSSVAGEPDRDAAAPDGDPDDAIRVDDRPGDGYLEVQRAVTPGAAATAEARCDALRDVGLEPWHLVLERGGRPLCAGLGVHDPVRHVVGVFSVATIPEARGRGAARRLMAHLSRRARDAAATGLYLQVDVRNEPGLRLYERGGFAIHHRYDYRIAPEG